jgi:hypothetical protein
MVATCKYPSCDFLIHYVLTQKPNSGPLGVT